MDFPLVILSDKITICFSSGNKVTLSYEEFEEMKRTIPMVRRRLRLEWAKELFKRKGDEN